MNESLRGKLLVAGPALIDPNFRRTVVLVLAHDADGAVGVVLNRRSDAEVEEAVPELTGLVEPGAFISIGGPVRQEAVIVVAEWDDPDEAGDIVFADVGLMDAEAELENVSAAARRVRVFAGYSGWSEQQLEAELDEGSWVTEDALPDDVFDERGDLWAAVLRRKGDEYRFLATMPEDPSLN
jgi:putative transcriptional regulator